MDAGHPAGGEIHHWTGLANQPHAGVDARPIVQVVAVAAVAVGTGNAAADQLVIDRPPGPFFFGVDSRPALDAFDAGLDSGMAILVGARTGRRGSRPKPNRVSYYWPKFALLAHGRRDDECGFDLH